jgi:hypothetical protein
VCCRSTRGPSRIGLLRSGQRGLDHRQQPRPEHDRPSQPGIPPTAGRAALPGSPIYHHALTAGVQAALSIGAAASILALIVTLVAIRVRRKDLPDSPLPRMTLLEMGPRDFGPVLVGGE